MAALAAVGLLGIASPVTADTVGRAVSEYGEKAELILSIAQFTDWPANLPRSPQAFVVGVLGVDPFGPVLDRTFAGRKIAGRPAVIRRYAAIDRLDRSDLLFICVSHRKAFDEILSEIGRSPTLTVADYPGFVVQGGAIELFMDAGHARFRVNRRAAESAGLNLRSQLLRSAAYVE